MIFKRAVSFILTIAILVCVTLSCSGCIFESKRENPIMTIKFAGGVSGYEGTVKIELYPDKAPNTVNNIIYLVKQGFFDGIKVNMTVENSFIEIADGSGLKTLGDTGAAPDYAIKGECTANGFKQNDLKFEKGSVALSRYEKTDYDSGVDGFFITMGEFPEADGEFAIFGKVIEGMNVVEDINSMKDTGPTLHYEPVYSVVVESVTVALKGEKYDEPEKIKREYYVWNSYYPWWHGDNE